MLKDLLMSKEEDQLKDLFDLCYQNALREADKTNPQMVASTYMAIAMRIYKTVLSADEYERMLPCYSRDRSRALRRCGDFTLNPFFKIVFLSLSSMVLVSLYMLIWGIQ